MTHLCSHCVSHFTPPPGGQIAFCPQCVSGMATAYSEGVDYQNKINSGDINVRATNETDARLVRRNIARRITSAPDSKPMRTYR